MYKFIFLFLAALCFSIGVPAQDKKQDRKTVAVEMSGDYSVRGSVKLSPKKFFMVEFPAGDEILTTASSDDDLIRGDESFEKRNDPTIPLLFRAEKDWGSDKEAVTLVIMMKSGAVLTLEVSPAASASESNDRVLWKYLPAKVAAVRNKMMTDVVVATEKNNDLPVAKMSNPGEGGMILVSATTADDPAPMTPQDTPPMPESLDPEAEKLAQETLAGLEPENFVSFPREKAIADNPDLTIAALKSQWVKNGTWTITVVGVQNKSRNNVQLIDFPRLRISTKGNKGQSLNDETITPLGVATSSQKYPIILPPTAVVYFSYVYRTPVLGSTQSMQVLASHTNLADKPAVIVVRPGGTN